mmetsp:Transcript_8885/g.15623  ORF Transcript_8885/g.15623 Transcript_8885/m.15623 type:complete len:226 (-) Transcript_8885:334-1011(-)
MTLFTPETQQQTPTETMGRGLKRGSFEPFVSATKRPRVSEPPQVFPGASKMQKTNTGAATTPSAGNGFGYSSNNSFGFNGGNNGSIFNNNNFNGNGNGFTFQQAQQNGSGVPGISPVQRKRRANDLDSMAQPGNMMTPEAAMAAPDGSLPTKRARMDPEAFFTSSGNGSEQKYRIHANVIRARSVHERCDWAGGLGPFPAANGAIQKPEWERAIYGEDAVHCPVP